MPFCNNFGENAIFCPMKKKRFTYPVFLILFCLFYSEFNAQDTSYSKIAVSLDDPFVTTQLTTLGLAIDHAEFLPDNSISFFVSPSDLALLDEAQITYRVEIEDFAASYAERTVLDAKKIPLMERTANVANGFDLGSMGGFYTWEEVEGKLDEMKQDYPNLITTKTSIGTSIEGREIWMAKISDNPEVDEEEPVAYFDALHHAREPLSMATTINFMFWLLENYDSDEQVRYLVDNREIYFVPVVNPDGYEFNREIEPEGGGLWRKNRNPNDGSCVGVDLNRNYSFAYGNNNDCSSPNPCSGIYRGEGAFSEPETAAVRDFLAEVSPKTAFSTHSTAGSYLMPYGFDTSPPEFDIYSEWASVFLSENDYPYGVTFQMLGYTSCGTTRDYMHSEGIYGWTPEIDGNGFWPDQSTIFDLVDENVYPLFYQSWISGAFVDVQSHEFSGNAVLGETFEMVVEVKNVGVGADATNVTVAVEASDSGITVTDPISYGTVPIRSRLANVGMPFIIAVDPDFDATSFELKISTFQDGVLNDVLELPVRVGDKEVLYYDDGSNGDENWTATGDGIPWSLVMDDAYSGTVCFGDSDGGNGVNNTLNFFELNIPFDFSNTIAPTAAFMAKYSMETGDEVDFEVSLDEGTSWEQISQFTESESWSPYAFDLQELAGAQSVRFRFAMNTDASIPGDGFYFDDFEIADYGEPILATNTPDFGFGVTVVPNPFSDEIRVTSANNNPAAAVQIALYDLRGRKIATDQRQEDSVTVISGLATMTTGMYFLKVGDENGHIAVHKLIKE